MDACTHVQEGTTQIPITVGYVSLDLYSMCKTLWRPSAACAVDHDFECDYNPGMRPYIF